MAEAVARILLVDDSAVDRRVLSVALRGHGYAVGEASSGESALVALSREEFDVVIADYYMGGMSGVDLLAGIRQTKPHIGRVLITAFPRFEQVAEAINRAGIHAFITKPPRPGELPGAIAQSLTRATRETRRDAT